MEVTCNALLQQLQVIWDELGEDVQKKVVEIEQECVQVYRRNLHEAQQKRASLIQMLSQIQAQITSLSALLGHHPPPLTQLDRSGATLREQVVVFTPVLEDLQRERAEHLKQVLDLKEQISSIEHELSASSPLPHYSSGDSISNDLDLSQRNINELHQQLQILQNEKNDRIHKTLKFVNEVNKLCKVLGLDFMTIIMEVHPNLNESSVCEAKNISKEAIGRLIETIESLQEEKRKRMQKIQDLGACLIELWNLMDTSMEEQQLFQHVTLCLAALEDEITAEGSLSVEVIKKAEDEVQHLNQLKACKIKELVLRKQSEMVEICRKTHMIPDPNMALDKIMSTLESGMVDPVELLEILKEQIGIVKEEAFSRKETMEKAEKWMVACEEEKWLEEYNKDGNRYNASKGNHINLKHAERARIAVSKMPALVDSIIAKIKAWEQEREKPFLYDGVRILLTLEEYKISRLKKEDARQQKRDQKFLKEQETLHGSRASPNIEASSKKRVMTPNSCRLPSRGGLGSCNVLMLRKNGANLLHQYDSPIYEKSKKDRAQPSEDAIDHYSDATKKRRSPRLQPFSPVIYAHVPRPSNNSSRKRRASCISKENVITSPAPHLPQETRLGLQCQARQSVDKKIRKKLRNSEDLRGSNYTNQ